MLRRFSILWLSLTALSLALLNGNLLHNILGGLSEMTGTQCQSACTNQQLLVGDVKKQDELKDKDIIPEPSEPNYLLFAVVGWTTVVYLSLAYIFRLLNMRPPDMLSLYGFYRI